MNIEILTDSLEKTFFDLIRESKEQFLASPFVKYDVAQRILENKPQRGNIYLLTNYKLSYFHRKSSDLKALKSFMENHIEVRNYPHLHAKTYLFDDERAIVTSANLTLGGFRKNYECGVRIEDRQIVRKLKDDFWNLFQDEEKSSLVSDEIISLTENILSKVSKERKTHFEKSEEEIFRQTSYEPQDDLYDGGEETIRDSLSGWRLDVFNILSDIPTTVFALKDVYSYTEKFQEKYPENLNIEAKIRQQLQELRDLGLVEFLGKGHYRKLWKKI